jgi:hypothetical protein
MLLWGVGVLAGITLAASAHATPIGPNCGTCQGSIYEITYSGVPISSTATTQTWEITYSINTAGYNGGGTRLNAVALKVSSQLVSADLVSAPGGVASWNEFMGGVNSGGCSMSGSGFDCVVATAIGSAPTVPDGVYTWVFDLEITNGGLFTSTDQSSIKARYANESGNKVGALVSEMITLEIIPEPSTALLLALGGSMLAAARLPRR